MRSCTLGPQQQGISRLQLTGKARATGGLEEPARATGGLEELDVGDDSDWVPKFQEQQSLVLGHTLCYCIGMSVAVNAFAKVRLGWTLIVRSNTASVIATF